MKSRNDKIERGTASKNLHIGIIGAGRVGENIAFQLAKAGWHIRTIFSRTKSSAEYLAKIIAAGAANSIGELLKKCDAVFITVPDDEIIPIAEKIAEFSQIRTKTLIHCSGVMPSSMLAIAGAEFATASMHPFASIPPLSQMRNPFDGVFFGCEGDDIALKLVNEMVSDIGGIFYRIAPEKKTSYHAAGAFGANFIYALAYIAQFLLQKSEIDEKVAHTVVTTSMRIAVDNYKKFGIPEAITGPVARGDVKMVDAHINALKNTEFIELYIAASRILAKITGTEEKFDFDNILKSNAD